MIVLHSLRLLCVRSVDVMTYSHLLFFSSIIPSTSLVLASMVLLPNGLQLNTISCMLYRDSVIPPMDQGCTVLCILSVDAFCMSL